MDFENIESGNIEDLLIQYIHGNLSEAENEKISRHLKKSKEDHKKYVSLLEIHYVMKQGEEIGDHEKVNLMNLINRHTKPNRTSYIIEYKNRKFQISSPNELEIVQDNLLSGLTFRGVESSSGVISKKIGDIDIKMFFSASKRNRISISLLPDPKQELLAILSINQINVETISTLYSSIFETVIDNSSDLEIDFYHKNTNIFSMQIELKISS